MAVKPQVGISAKFNYLWRLLATGTSFTLFGVGALFLTIFIFPPLIFLIRDADRKKFLIRGIVSSTFKLFVFFMEKTGIFDLELKNLDRMKHDRGCLIVSNHPTLIDVVFIVALYPNACCIVKKALWNNFFLRGVVKAAGYIPNDDPVQLINRAKTSLASGDVLIVFPEGTRTRPNEPLDFKRGASHIAYALQCPIRFIRISCAPLTLTKGVPWYQIPPRKVDFKFEVLEKIHVSDVASTEVPRSIAARRITRKLLSVYTNEQN